MSAELVCGDLVVTFSDERSVLLSADFLYASIPQGRELFEVEELGDEEELVRNIKHLPLEEDVDFT